MNISLENHGLTVTVSGTGRNDGEVLSSIAKLLESLRGYSNVDVSVKTKPLDIIQVSISDLDIYNTVYGQDTISGLDIISIGNVETWDTMISTR
jgi:hypothetical protein